MISLPREMKLTYLVRRTAEIEQLKEAVRNNSVEVFNRVGHQIIGNSKNFGFEILEPVANRMNTLKLSELQTYWPELIDEFSNLVDQLKKELAESSK